MSYYKLDGIQVSATRKGVNIVRYSDGTVKKVLTKQATRRRITKEAVPTLLDRGGLSSHQ
ncbi:MAG: hypothetical protein LUC44_06520 [Prevotellaceae bacterium]|nr:hypothetical protein [Prevotellaceae bacterium]